MDTNGFGRCVIFVDNSNIFKNMKRDARIDWIKLISYLKDLGLNIWDKWFFIGESAEPRESQNRFLEMLADYGFNIVQLQLKKRTITCPGCGENRQIYVEKGVDVAITTHMLKFLYNNAYDTAILISGDGDLSGVAQEIRRYGRKVIVISFREAMSGSLDQVSNKTIYLDDIAEKVKLERNAEYENTSV